MGKQPMYMRPTSLVVEGGHSSSGTPNVPVISWLSELSETSTDVLELEPYLLNFLAMRPFHVLMSLGLGESVCSVRKGQNSVTSGCKMLYIVFFLQVWNVQIWRSKVLGKVRFCTFYFPLQVIDNWHWRTTYWRSYFVLAAIFQLPLRHFRFSNWHKHNAPWPSKNGKV